MSDLMKRIKTAAALLAAASALTPLTTHAWDYEVHRFINQIALTSLPTNYPSFALTPAARERIAFLAGEPDRWRNTPDLNFRHQNGPDHFLDVEDLAPHGLAPETLSPFRYDFMAQLAVGRTAHATNFPSAPTGKDLDHTRALIGFLPWTMAEQQAKLKSAFSYLRELEAAGTPEEVQNARENVIYLMGVMGHFVGDATHPLHTTRHYNGWVGPNPNQYTTSRRFHAWIDSEFLRATGVKTNETLALVRPARLPWPATTAGHTNAFPELLSFLLEQHKLVEPLYALEKEKKLTPGEKGAEEGQSFLTAQLLKAGQMLGDLWLAAWQEAPKDSYLQAELAKRKAARNP